jgi:hypothetical protein
MNDLMTKTTEQQNAIALQREILSGSQDANNVLTTSGQVGPLFHAHYTNMETAENGIANLIAKILKENGSNFPLNIANSEFRNIAIAGSMFASDIFAATQLEFSAGSIRYPYETIHAYLSVFMSPDNKHKLAGLPRIGKIDLTSNEDYNRPAVMGKDGKKRKTKPRRKWFLIQ